MDPSDPETLYAASYDRFRKPWTWGIGGTGSGIHKTTDGGKSWTKLTAGLPGGIIGRIGLAVYPKNPKILYAEIENANKPGMAPADRYREVLEGKSSSGMIDGEIYRSDDAGATWAKVSPEKRSIGGNPGYYYGQIVVDPNDAERRLRPERRRPGQPRRRQDLDLAVPLRRRQPRPLDRSRGQPSHAPRLRSRPRRELGRRQELVPPRFPVPGPVLRHRLRHVLSLPRRRRPPGQRQPDGPEHQGRRRGRVRRGRRRVRAAHTPRGLVQSRRRRRHVQRLRPGDQPLRSTTNPSSARCPASISRPANRRASPTSA